LSLDDLYKETILDHYQHPRNRGKLEDPDVATRGHNPLGGDEVLLAVKFDGDLIQDIAFGGRGCSIGQASASMMTEAVKGHHLGEATALSASFKDLMTGNSNGEGLEGNEDLEALQGVKKFPVRVKCALLPWTALNEVIERWQAAGQATKP
jgi:nitrogen fixation NifU-like protein